MAASPMKTVTLTASSLATGLSTSAPTEQSCKVQSTGSVREMATGVTQNQSAKVGQHENLIFYPSQLLAGYRSHQSQLPEPVVILGLLVDLDKASYNSVIANTVPTFSTVEHDETVTDC